MVEGIAQEEQISAISLKVGTIPGATRRDRSAEWLLNLVDLNIVPINIHAMMRDVPLANLYNYSYTFEQMVAAMLGQNVTDIEGRSLDQKDPMQPNAIRDTKQLLVKMLIDPYVDIPSDVFGSDLWDIGSTGLVHRLFRGDTSTGMGRPKFLSDEIFGKVLFGSPYQQSSEYDEAGPGVGAGVSRGREQPVGDSFYLADHLRTGLFGATAAAAPTTVWGWLEAAAAADATGRTVRDRYGARLNGGPVGTPTPFTALAQAANDLPRIAQTLGRRPGAQVLTVAGEATALAAYAGQLRGRIEVLAELGEH